MCNLRISRPHCLHFTYAAASITAYKGHMLQSVSLHNPQIVDFTVMHNCSSVELTVAVPPQFGE
jgi:hypothetical protein